MADNKLGETVGSTVGGLAAGGLLGLLDGPSPILDIVGGTIGSSIGGAIGGNLPGGKKRLAGEALQYSPLDMAGLMEGMRMPNPNTQGLGARFSDFQQNNRNQIAAAMGLPAGSFG